jgi:hypothetical protein
VVTDILVLKTFIGIENKEQLKTLVTLELALL